MIDYNRLENYTAQQVFDHITTHLLTQKHPAIWREPTSGKRLCVMINKEGFRCAAGSLIPVYMWLNLLETHKDTGSYYGWAAWRQVLGLSDMHDHLIEALQSIHDATLMDDYKNHWEQWSVEVVQLAEKLSLHTENIKEHLHGNARNAKQYYCSRGI